MGEAVENESVDLVISNCVINLSPDKASVYREAFRVLKPGGRLVVSDIVATAPFPDEVRNDLELYSSCVSGAATMDELMAIMKSVGFSQVKIDLKKGSRKFIKEWMSGTGVEEFIVSANIEAVRPG